MQVTTKLQYKAEGGINDYELNEPSAAVTRVGTEKIGIDQVVGNGAWELLALGDCSAPCEIAVQNESVTPGQYIMVALANDDSGKFARIYPGQTAKIMLETVTTYVKAAAGTPKLSGVAAEL